MQESDATTVINLRDLSASMVASFMDKLCERIAATYDVTDLKADGVFETAVMSMLLYGAAEWSRLHGVDFSVALRDVIDADSAARKTLKSTAVIQ